MILFDQAYFLGLADHLPVCVDGEDGKVMACCNGRGFPNRTVPRVCKKAPRCQCGHFPPLHVVDDQSGLGSVFDEESEGCGRIKRIGISGCKEWAVCKLESGFALGEGLPAAIFIQRIQAVTQSRSRCKGTVYNAV